MTAFLLSQYGIGLHTSIANVGVSEPGRESKTGVYGSDMVCVSGGIPSGG